MLNLKKVLCLCSVFLYGCISAMRLPTESGELSQKANAIVVSIPGYNGELDPKKFVDDVDSRNQVRTNIAKKFISSGQNFYSSYAVSRRAFFFFIKRRIDSNFDASFTTEYEKIKAIDTYMSMLTSDDEKSLVPVFYLSYYYCNRLALSKMEELYKK